jgi:hypothetical protein
MRPALKITEFGEVPEDWNIVEYCSFGRIIDGDRGISYPSAADLRDDGHCLLKAPASTS